MTWPASSAPKCSAGGGQPTSHFGDPLWVYLQYRRKKGDARADDRILREGEEQIETVRRRGVFIAQGHAQQPWELMPDLRRDVYRIYEDAKDSLWTELDPHFIGQIPGAIRCSTCSQDRMDYILHPATGERVSDDSLKKLRELRSNHQS